MYGRRTAEDVHAILRRYQSSYIILEDSICLSRSKDGCGLPDIIDVDNGVVRRYYFYLMCYLLVEMSHLAFDF